MNQLQGVSGKDAAVWIVLAIAAIVASTSNDPIVMISAAVVAMTVGLIWVVLSAGLKPQ